MEIYNHLLPALVPPFSHTLATRREVSVSDLFSPGHFCLVSSSPKQIAVASALLYRAAQLTAFSAFLPFSL